ASTRAASAGCILRVTRKVGTRSAPLQVALDEGHELLAGDAEASSRLAGEGGAGHAGREAVGGLVVGPQVDLQEAELGDGVLALQAGGEGQEVGGDEGLGT